MIWKMSVDTADWKAVVTIKGVGRVDIATIVIQEVRVNVWASSTRP